ncbi:MAG TPA: hypothetical protein VGS78_17000 [Candidatus Sulfotelmatobacter sp.]|nr:hypothetical protein [Candidatus Sulfotelmatobacter sp.]
MPVSLRRVMFCRFVGMVMLRVVMMSPNGHQRGVRNIGKRKRTAE